MKKNLRIRRIITNVMRITFTQLVISMLFFGVSLARDGYSQEVLNQKISIKVQEQSVKQVLNQIEKVAEIRFIYSPNLIQSERKVSVNLNNSSLNDVLRNLLTPLNIEYRVSGRQIVLKRGENKATSIIFEENPKIEVTEIQENVITGKVSDASGESLVGVSIQVKGTTKGTTTDSKGEYKISVENSNSVLVFTFIGYITQEVKVGNQSRINISLQSDEKILEEVVVVGYGTQKKENLTGAVSTIDSKAIENRPSSNLANALQGTSPGLIVTRTNGQPGSEGIGVQIRGASSANGSIDPLVILDGVTVPSNTLQSLNPNDVENISVLKDAAAAAIYGAQAAGGVILVTTKKAKSGKVRFNYLAQQGTDWTINVPQRMSLLEEAEFSNLARKNSGSAPEYSADDIQRIKDNVPYVVNPADTTTYLFYNQIPLTDQVLKKYSSMSTHNLSMSGGTDKLNFLLSGGFYSKDGIFKIGPDSYKRYNLRLNLGAELNKYFSIDARLAYTKDEQKAASGGLNGQGLIYEIYRLRTRTPFFTPDGLYNGAGSAATVYARLESGGYNNYVRNYYDGTFTLKAANLVKGLTLRAVLGTQYRVGDRNNFARTVPLWGRGKILSYINQVNSYTLTDELTNNTNVQFLGNYDLKIVNKHSLNFLLGYQWEDYRFENMVAGATNLVSNDLPTLNLGDDKTKTNSQSIGTSASQSIFTRFNYNFDGRYLFEATLRRDESSKLAPDLRVKFFPSASVGWNLHRENFLKTITVISELKLRGSWGRLGGALASNIIGNYDYLSQLSRGSALVLGDSRASYLFQSSIPSQSLSWETIETTNVGFDLGLFKNKFTMNADYYVKYNRNMLTPQNLPAVIGIGTPRKNNGELKSWGWEIEARYRGKIGPKFSYTIAGNLSDNQNKLLNFAGRNIVGAGTNGIIEGYPLNSIFGYKTEGYFQTADEVKAWAFQDNRTGAGDVKYLDLNGDGRINVGKGNTTDYGDLVFLGTTQPRYIFGSTISFDFRGFDFTAFIQGVGKRSFRPETQTIAPLLVTWKQPLAIHRDYWTPENPDALYPRPYTSGDHNYRVSDKWLLNGRYARLKNLQVGYTIPERISTKIKVARARVFFSAQDILTVSKLGSFKGYFDPEQRDNIENDYPFFATASAGINLNF